MTKDDLKQLGDLMDSKLEKAFKDNNKTLKSELSEIINEKLEKAVSEIASMVNVAFTEFEEKTSQQFDKINEALSQKPSLHEINAWADSNLIPFQKDVEKLKFLHIKELKDIPDNLTISSALIDEGL